MRSMVEKFAGGFVLVLAALAVLTLAAPAAAAPEVRAEWAEDALAGVTEYDECTAFEGEPQAKVLLSAERAVRDLKVLRLTFTEISEEGKVSFDVEERYGQKELLPGRPLLVRMMFFGTIPNNGISYVDGEGVTRRFVLDQSGEDGSLLLTEF